MGLNLILIIFAAVFPALVVILSVHKRDKYQPEPTKEIAKAFAWGLVSVGFAVIPETIMTATGFVEETPTTFVGAAKLSFLCAALCEECAKLLVLYLFLKKSKYFDEYTDGIVYAVAVGMGFAGLENVMYLFSNLGSWQAVGVARALFSIPGHYIFAVAMGYFYALWHYKHTSLIWALVVPILLHGAYDTIVFSITLDSPYTGLLALALIVFMIYFLVRSSKYIKRHLDRDIVLLQQRREEEERLRQEAAEEAARQAEEAERARIQKETDDFIAQIFDGK
ncbi:MAG: PrsW family intramembrane metalloprotease [Paludibacteraceae bacterium]|nr:PrsW family intramembrane metalloprotease [Paludibacteraceae bacterium]